MGAAARKEVGVGQGRAAGGAAHPEPFLELWGEGWGWGGGEGFTNWFLEGQSLGLQSWEEPVRRKSARTRPDNHRCWPGGGRGLTSKCVPCGKGTDLPGPSPLHPQIGGDNNVTCLLGC